MIVVSVGVSFFLSRVLFSEERLKQVTAKRSERQSQWFRSLFDEVWVSRVNDNHFFESKSTSTVDINR